MKFAVMASGGGTDFQSLIDAVKAGQIDAEICCLIASKPDIYAVERAKKAGIPVEIVQKKFFGSVEAFDRAILATLKRYLADFVVLAGYLNIVGPQTISAYENKIINIHPALIPSFCGMGMYGSHVHEAVIAYGAKYSGATVHFVNEEADAGPIILQEVVPVLEDDTPEDLAARVLKTEHQLLPRAVALMAGGKLRVEGRIVKILE
ncbi:phosphoribosylglycinamide formyltransferase [Christensenella minuta]|uniref:phosphoribosylglycinamide formyltransferase n=1 Tax=Christensenella minuta TaxID=626937 RepID=UPI000EAF2E0F|nr:phosphoribosylglycinamide formyltransferase [Christensenella minuta]